MSAGILFFSSTVFLACSDDDGKLPKDMLGPSFIQVITAGTDYVDLQWTITPTENVDGYKVQIFSGTIGNLGSEVTSGTFEKKVYQGTFKGLQPDTKYVIATQCIPAAGSKFTKADVAYFEFTTAPSLTITSVTADVSQSKDSDGEPMVNDDGEPVYQAAITVKWSENLTIQQVNNIYIYLGYWAEGADSDVQVAYFTTPQLGSSSHPSTTLENSYTFVQQNVVPGAQYEIDILPNPSAYSWFTTATVDWSIVYFMMPEAE